MIDDEARVVTAVDDVLVRNGEALVLVVCEVMLLSEIPAAMVQLCAEGMRVGELRERLVAQFGAPAHGVAAAERVTAILEELAKVGIVRIDQIVPSGA